MSYVRGLPEGIIADKRARGCEPPPEPRLDRKDIAEGRAPAEKSMSVKAMSCVTELGSREEVWERGTRMGSCASFSTSMSALLNATEPQLRG